MSKMIEEHIYYMQECPRTGNPILITNCFACDFRIRQLDNFNQLHPGAPEHERIVCTFEHPAQGSLIPV
jgi:hypothetical protein